MSYKFLIKLKVFLYINYPKKEIDIIYEKNIIFMIQFFIKLKDIYILNFVETFCSRY